ncbi:MAG: hypothetical protein NT062_29140 [Proteobacteria bacterium]|nr:hypothetical protein [Pseudomonadota bacterium]
MHGVTGILIKLGVRLVVFTAVFWFAAHKNKKIVLGKRWAAPVIGLVFAILNTALYWLLAPVFNLASLGAIGFAMPLIVNGVLLYGTEQVFGHRKLVGGTGEDGKPKRVPLLQIQGVFAMLWTALFLTLAHGACWVALDYLPSK